MSAFKPTHDWQPVPEDAVLPPGLQVEMDMTTGRQRARIPPANGQANGAGASGAGVDYEALVKAYAAKHRPPPGPDLKPGRLDWPALAPRLPPPREWIWDQQIPAHTVTLLHGGGGIGKTTLLQQIATACAMTAGLFGDEPLKTCKVLAWFGEDDHDEIWRRQAAINRMFGFAETATTTAFQEAMKPRRARLLPPDVNALLPLAGNAEFYALPGDDITLFLGKNEAEYSEGPALPILREQIGDFRPGLVILDSVAKIYGGQENNRQLVTRCVQTLIKLCLEFGTTIILNGHDNKLGEYSGSTAWETTVRSRLHFKREVETDDNGKPVKGGSSHNVLVRSKTNYSAVDEHGIAMKWYAGAFVGLDPKAITPEMQAAIKEQEGKAEQAFLAALRELTGRQISTSDAVGSPYYAPKQIGAHGLANDITREQLGKAMRRLLMSGAVTRGDLPWKTKNRMAAHGLIPAGE